MYTINNFTNNDDIKVFVIPTAGTLTIVQGVEFSEDISKLEYKWDNGEYVDITESYLNTQTNRVVIPEKEFTSAGTHKLYVKATDIAGNVKEVWKEYSIKSTEIDVTLSTYELTNEDIKVTVDFGDIKDGLTEQKIVKFRKAGSEIYVDVTPSVQKDRFYERAQARNLGDSADEVYENASSKAKIYIHPTAMKADIILSGEADRSAYKKFVNKILSLVEELYSPQHSEEDILLPR